MGAETLGAVILWLIVAAVVVVVAVYLLRWLYRRSTKEIAFVRTGFGGERSSSPAARSSFRCCTRSRPSA